MKNRIIIGLLVLSMAVPSAGTSVVMAEPDTETAVEEQYEEATTDTVDAAAENFGGTESAEYVEEEIQNEQSEEPQETEEGTQTEQSQLKENSWRYTDGMILNLMDGTAVPNAWTKNENGYYINSFGDVIPNAVKKGIDVSEHQGTIDWNAVKNSDIDFVIIRCGYGNDDASQDDKQWLRNVQECERLGIPYGVYLYSYAKTESEARSEAAHVLRLLQGHNPSYPVYIDMEDNTTLGSKDQFANFAEIFCTAVENAGYKAGVYANLNWWNNYLKDSRFSRWDRWVAQYNYQCDYQGTYSIWQCTSTGYVSGISGCVDLNFQMGTTSFGNSGNWVEKNGQKYYYVNGTMLTNVGREIDGYWYYFQNDGSMLTGWRDKNGDKYYYDSQGHMVANVGMAIDGYWYYFQSSGAMLRGWRDKNGDKYYYDSQGHMASNVELQIDGNWYYFQSSGAAYRGWRDRSGKICYYDGTGCMVVSRGLEIDGYWYYFQADGNMLKGWRDKNGDKYYYDSRGVMTANRGVEIDGNWYYFQSSGAMLRGWRDKNGDKYYYDSNGVMVANRGVEISGNWYYFQSSGAMLRGWRGKNGDSYYYDGEGRMLASCGAEIDGYWYYFQSSGAMAKNYWRDKNGDKYYYESNGVMVANRGIEIDGNWYYFQSSGAMAKNYWRDKNGDKYYYDSKGRMIISDTVEIGGQRYSFDASGRLI